MQTFPRKLLLLSFIAILLVATLPACSPTQEGAHLNMASMNKMPAEVQSAPVTVQQAYQFALANPDVLEQIPCYCGCGKIGHTSNYSCYVQNADDPGNIVFDNHALGCSICVDITQDTMRLMKQGKSPGEIRAYTDATYSKFGPSNILNP
jgi:hypothetical protein